MCQVLHVDTRLDSASSVAHSNFALCLMQPAMKMAKGIQELTERSPALPVACHICSDEFEDAYNHEANVFHGKSNLHSLVCQSYSKGRLHYHQS